MHLEFYKVAEAVLKIILIIGTGFFISCKGWVQNGVTEFLTNLVVKITAPALVFSTFIANSKFFHQTNFTFLLVSTLGFFILGILNSLPFVFMKNMESRREFIMLVTFQNCGYLPMTLSYFLFPPQTHQKFLVFIFVYIMGFNFLMWSGGTIFLSRYKLRQIKWGLLLPPPVLGVVFSFFLVYTNLSRWIPTFIVDTAAVLGNTTFVLSMFLLGIFLHQDADFLKSSIRKGVLFAAPIKLFLIPLEVFMLLKFLNIPALERVFLAVQACMPSAANLPIVASWAKADKGFMAQGVFISNVLSIFTIPLWFGIMIK